MTYEEKYQQQQSYKHLLYMLAQLAHQKKAIITVFPNDNTWEKWSFLIEMNPTGQAWETVYTAGLEWDSHFEACEHALRKYQMLYPKPEHQITAT